MICVFPGDGFMCTCLCNKNLCLFKYYNKSTKRRLHFKYISTKYDDVDDDDDDDDEYTSFPKVNTSIENLCKKF